MKALRLLGLSAVLALAFSPNGKTVATVGRGSDLYLWDVDTGRQLRRAPLDLSPVFAVRYSPQSHNGSSYVELAIIDAEGRLRY